MSTGVEVWGILPLLIVSGCILLAALVLSAGRARRHATDTDLRTCRPCALAHPSFAHYCRRCGRKL